MKKLLTILICLFGILNCNQILAKDYNNNSKTAKIELLKGSYINGQAILGLSFELKENWKIYWKLAGDVGFSPEVKIKKSANVKDLKIKWPYPTRLIEEVEEFKFESYIYEDKVILPIIVESENNLDDISLDLSLIYGICEKICIAEETNFSFYMKNNFENKENLEKISLYQEKVPTLENIKNLSIDKISIDKDKTYLQILVNSKESLKNADLFIIAGDDFAFYKPEFIGDNLFNAPITYLTKDKNIDNKKFEFTLVVNNKAIEISKMGSEFSKDVVESKNINNIPLLLIILFAIIGGLILNIMPCVLPVLSIKMLSVIKHSGQDKAVVRKNFYMIALGIYSCFLILASIIIAFKYTGNVIGWGFHFQEPLFVISLILIITFFIANLIGLFEFQIPSIIADRLSVKENIYLENYLTGLFAAIMATPCTAPFLGTAVGFAFSQDYLSIILIFLAIGFGLSIPYLLVSIYPGLVNKLPKPGNWMGRVKIIFSLLLLITIAWLFWILLEQLGQRSILALLISLIAIIGALYFKNEFKIFSKKITYILLIIAAFTLPIKYMEGRVNLKFESDLNWQKFQEDKIQDFVLDGKIVFVDVTANWCITCKVNQFLVLDRSVVKERLNDKNIILMKGDWTNKNENITKYLQKHGRLGIPFNIIYGPKAKDGIILSELLSKDEVFNALEKAK